MYVSKPIKLNISRECVLLYMNCAPINLELKKHKPQKERCLKL